MKKLFQCAKDDWTWFYAAIAAAALLIILG